MKLYTPEGIIEREATADDFPSYMEARRIEYIKPEEFADALAKMQSDDPIIKGAGEAQLKEISLFNLAVKEKYPKG